jgi:septum formation protein
MLEQSVYLASRSPRRRALLEQIGIDFEVLPARSDREPDADVDEAPLSGETAHAYTLRICRAKARAGWARLAERPRPRLPVLAADTVVTVAGALMGKPADAEEACAMLRRLSGREHHVWTSVAIVFEERVAVRSARTRVVFRSLTEAEIRAYVGTGEPMDKAGAYAIQGRAAVFITSIEGSYSAVMGLPLFETAELLARFGVRAL